MAVVSNSQQDLDSQNQNGQSPSGGSSAPVSVAGATTGSSSPSTGQSGQSQSQSSQPTAGTSGDTQNTSSGGFTNLKSYLNANSNYNGGQGLSGEVNSNLQNQSSNINNNINNASNQFQTQTVNSVAPVTQNYNSFESGTGNGSDLNAIQNYAGNTQNVQNTQNLEGASYTGPNSLNDLTGANNGAALQSQVANYNGLVQNAGTAAGSANLLQNLYGKQGYNQGQQTLDSAFLQGANFAPAQAAGNQLGNAYNTASNNATAQGQAAGQQVQQYANNVSGQLNNAENNLYGGVNQAYNTNLQGQAAQVAAQQQALQNYNVGQGEATGLGLTQGQNLYNSVNAGNVGNYVSANNAYGVQDAATSNQLAQNQALSNLLGGYATTGSQSNINNLNAANTGGLINYNGAGLNAAATQAGTDFNNQANPDVALFNQGSQQEANLFGQTGGTGPDSIYSPQTASGILSNYNNPFAQALLGANGFNTIGDGVTQVQQAQNPGTSDWMQQEIAAGALQNLANQYGYGNNLNISGA